MSKRANYLVVWALLIAFVGTYAVAEPPKYDDKHLARDLELIQGSWQLLHGNEGKGPPTIRSIKTLKGNRSTLRRYNIKTGKLFHEHSSEFQLSKSGDVRVFTFYRVGGTPEQGGSYVYKVDGDSFWDVPGLLHGTKYRNYQRNPTVWHWKRVKTQEDDVEARKGASDANSPDGSQK